MIPKQFKDEKVTENWFSKFMAKIKGIIPILVSLSTRVFKTRTPTGRERFKCQDNGVSQILILIISNGEKILSKINVVE